MSFIFSKHALEQMLLRGISKDVVLAILKNPQQIVSDGDKKVYQGIVENGKYLIRIFVNHKKNPKVVITVYKTSKINKYL